MTGRVTKEKAKPRKASEPKTESTNTADTNLLLIWLCMKNNGGKSINFESVGAAMNVSPVAAKSRYRRVKERVDAMMEAMETPKDPKPESASKQAKQDDQEQAKESYSEELAKDI